MNKDRSQLVYSTEHGRCCPKCKKPFNCCSCKQQTATPCGDGIVRIGRSTKGRKGKGVTTIAGMPVDDAGLKQIAKTLKKKCGTGGTVKKGIIEIQGDHRDLLVSELSSMGYKVKKSGG
jgi:translation initiation factor 1